MTCGRESREGEREGESSATIAVDFSYLMLKCAAAAVADQIFISLDSLFLSAVDARPTCT